ncbi:15008_t:CDS:1 [Acaulospora morrowiae]|uniref:15008_t:CDS:1 n=1 Tax=Acaulospora morrowiae TaxID=94023 RepID=A0A9N9C1C4_9GLOM|nr:15008_t:CDS:1 [Acaulospora morrowiae]
MSEVSLKSILERWHKSSCHLLDLRFLNEHNDRRIIPSTCIPYDELDKRQFELPHKSLPFSVLEPRGNEGIAKTLLIDRGWNVQWVFIESEELWKTGRELGIVEEDEGSKLCEPKRKWILFQPCPFLVNTINLIEESLRNANRENMTFKCLDIACGSGRDVSWLCLRQSVEWRVTAMDAMDGAISRTRQLAEGLGVLHKIQTIHAKILSDGTLKLLSSSIEDTDENKSLMLSSNLDFPTEGYDLILCVRFLCRGFFGTMEKMVKSGGFLLISTFVDDKLHAYDKPKGESHRLKPGELEKTFHENFEILQDKIELMDDGRPVNSFLARKR